MFYLRCVRRNLHALLGWLTAMRQAGVLHCVSVERIDDAIVVGYAGKAARDSDVRLLLGLFHTLALLGEWDDADTLEQSDDGEMYSDCRPAAQPVPLSAQADPALLDTGVLVPCPSLRQGYAALVEPGQDQFKVLSLGFEFQSADLFTVVIEPNANDDSFDCRYAEDDDIPENQPVPLSPIGQTQVGLQLDAVQPVTEGDPVYYINKIEPAMSRSKLFGKTLCMVESESPSDTELVCLNTQQEQLLCFEPAGTVDPVALMISHYQYLRFGLFRSRLKRYKACKYTTMLGSTIKTNLLRVPKLLDFNTPKSFGFIQHAFDPAELNKISFVPQVTFCCPLQQCYLVLAGLIGKTHDNSCLSGLKRAQKLVEQLCGARHAELVATSGPGFLLLLSYYLHVMERHSKQELGIAFRHGFREVYDSLGQEDSGWLVQATDGRIDPMLLYAEQFEAHDGIHKYPYAGDLAVLIEYRLFHYVVSTEGWDSVDVSGQVPDVVFAMEEPENEDSDVTD